MVHLPRIERLYQKYDNQFLDKVLTVPEKMFCISPVSLKVKVARIGGRIAAKEAVVKSLGMGVSTLGHAPGAYWKDVELLRQERQAPRLKLYQKAADKAATLGIENWLISLSHDGDYAIATVIGLKQAQITKEKEETPSF